MLPRWSLLQTPRLEDIMVAPRQKRILQLPRQGSISPANTLEKLQ